MKTAIRVVVFLALIGRLFAVDSADPRLGAYRASIAQESVQAEAGKTKADLAALIAEARLNGIGDENAAALNAFLEQLGSLTKDDMRKVIDALKTASATAENKNRQGQILAASENQQAIANRLFALAANIAANHAKQSLSHDLRDLLGRQLANIRLTLRLQAPGVQPQAADLARIAANQKDIASRTTAVIESMQQLLTSLPPAEAEPIKVAFDSFVAAKLTEATTQAASSAADKDLPTTGRFQARVRDILLAGTQAMNGKQTLADKLVGLSETIERLIAAQIALNADTRAASPDAAALAVRQTSLADETGILRTITPSITKENTASLEQARLAMQVAGASLDRGDTGAPTRDKQDEALAALRKAREQALAQMKNEMERIENTPQDSAQAKADAAAALASMSNQYAAANANAEAQAAAAAAAAQAAANTANAAMEDSAAKANAKAAAANAAANAASNAAAAATSGAAKAGFEKAAAAFSEAANAAKAGKFKPAVESAATGGDIVADSISAAFLEKALPSAAGPNPNAGLPVVGGPPSGPRGPGAEVVGQLRPRDREAIAQVATEKTPAEFTPLVRQYFKNLADDQNR